MTAKTDTEVLIGGKVYTLSGYESEEYLQKVALYINNKISEYNKVEGFDYYALASEIEKTSLKENLLSVFFEITCFFSLLRSGILLNLLDQFFWNFFLIIFWY